MLHFCRALVLVCCASTLAAISLQSSLLVWVKPEMSIFRRARPRPIKFCSALIKGLSRIPFLFGVFKRVRELPVVRSVLKTVAGYQRPFPTFADAAAAMAGDDGGGHSNHDYIGQTFRNAKKARPSDYPALFYIQGLLPQIGTVFDLAGGLGNAFYCYSKYMDMPVGLSWRVLELPEQRRIGAELAKERNEPRVHFAANWDEAEGVDLLIITGALHCIEKPLSGMISELGRKPQYVLINRAALVECPAFATIQEGGGYRLACFLYNRDELIRGFESLGYELVDSWRIAEPEHKVVVTCYPDRSVKAYSGLFLRLNEPGNAPLEQGREDRAAVLPPSA
jgi:putative methyltransferase (TIGR04325 family)